MSRVTIQPLTAADEAAVLAFEQENRAFFACTIGDRGDRFFADYPQQHADWLAEAARGESLLYLVREGADLVGRVNFTRIHGGAAWLGYRFAERVRGRGYATEAVAQALVLAGAAGVCEVNALVALDNPASARVLAKVGFEQLAAEPPEQVKRGGEWVEVKSFRLMLPRSSLAPCLHPPFMSVLPYTRNDDERQRAADPGAGSLRPRWGRH